MPKRNIPFGCVPNAKARPDGLCGIGLDILYDMSTPNTSAPKTPVRAVVDVAIQQLPASPYGYRPLEFTQEPWRVPEEAWAHVESRVYWCDECTLYHPRPGYCIKTLKIVVEVCNKPEAMIGYESQLAVLNIPFRAPFDGWLQGSRKQGPYRGVKVW